MSVPAVCNDRRSIAVGTSPVNQDQVRRQRFNEIPFTVLLNVARFLSMKDTLFNFDLTSKKIKGIGSYEGVGLYKICEIVEELWGDFTQYPYLPSVFKLLPEKLQSNLKIALECKEDANDKTRRLALSLEVFKEITNISRAMREDFTKTRASSSAPTVSVRERDNFLPSNAKEVDFLFCRNFKYRISKIKGIYLNDPFESSYRSCKLLSKLSSLALLGKLNIVEIDKEFNSALEQLANCPSAVMRDEVLRKCSAPVHRFYLVLRWLEFYPSLKNVELALQESKDKSKMLLILTLRSPTEGNKKWVFEFIREDPESWGFEGLLMQFLYLFPTSENEKKVLQAIRAISSVTKKAIFLVMWAKRYPLLENRKIALEAILNMQGLSKNEDISRVCLLLNLLKIQKIPEISQAARSIILKYKDAPLDEVKNVFSEAVIDLLKIDPSDENREAAQELILKSTNTVAALELLKYDLTPETIQAIEKIICASKDASTANRTENDLQGLAEKLIETRSIYEALKTINAISDDSKNVSLLMKIFDLVD